jgi:hypothetical protein
MTAARVAEVVWYVTGRFYTTSTSLFDVGYFIHIQGIAAPLFSGPMSEQTARFTFSASPFSARTIENGGLEIGIDPRGTFRIFLRESGASFDRPESFSEGTCIATLERIAVVPTVKTATLLSNVFSARLVSTEPFHFGGSRYDLRELLGAGVTQWGTAAPEAITPPAGFTSAVPFVGSAIAWGRTDA